MNIKPLDYDLVKEKIKALKLVYKIYGYKKPDKNVSKIFENIEVSNK